MSAHGPRAPRAGLGVVLNGPSSHDWLVTYETVVLLTLTALPLALLATHLLIGWRCRRGLPGTEARLRSVAEIGLIYGTVPWLWLTMLPASTTAGPRAVSVVPLRDLATMPTYQVLGNLLVLAALGLFGPIRFSWLRSVPRATLAAAGTSVLIESTQYALALGRVASIDDVLLNTVGAAAAALLSWPVWRQRGALRVA